MIDRAGITGAVIIPFNEYISVIKTRLLAQYEHELLC